MADRPGDKQGKIQLEAWSKEWISALIYHCWLAAVWKSRDRDWERSEITNGFYRQAGLHRLAFMAHQSFPVWLIGGFVTLTSIAPSRESITVTVAPSSTVFSVALADSAPARNVSGWCLIVWCFYSSLPTKGMFTWFPSILSVVGLGIPPWGECWQCACYIHHAGTMIGPNIT